MSEEIIFFEIFPWNKNFETGIELIDEQHKQLVHILNKLAAHLANRSDEVVLNDIFDELANYADYHFKTEEEIWSGYFDGDEWYEKHEKTHRSFIGDVLALKENKDEKALDDVVYDIVSFLSKWLAYHILDTDKRMAKAVQALESGATMPEAKIRANDEMSGSMKVLVQTVLSMYDSLSTRTLDLMREKSLRKQAESALSKSEERWKFVLDGGSEDVWDWDIENDKLDKSVGGITIFEITGNKLADAEKDGAIHPADRERVKADFQAHLDGKTEFYNNKHRVLRENGSWSWVLSRGKVVSRDKDGRALRMVGTHSDITERELATLIYKNSAQAMLVADMNNNIISINPSFTSITGYREEDLIGKNPNFIKSGRHDGPFYKEMWDTINTKGVWSGEIWNRRKNGEVYPEILTINTVKNEQGQTDHYLALFNDISSEKKYEAERKKQEEYLLQQSRMAQMGEMISMIAHQWRQPLGAIAATSIDLQTKMALDVFNLDDEAGRGKCQDYFEKNLQLVDDYVQNLSMTIDDFRNFYKPNKQSTNSLICTPVKKALQVIRPLLVSGKIELTENYDCDKAVEMFENEMMQVMMNILKNSHDNFHDKGTLNPVITLSARSDEESSVIEICDNGGGLDEDILHRVFDPYFSTKDEKNGTGLGLYMSKTIIEVHHKGKLIVENRDGGACFIIKIPNHIGT